MLPSPRDILLRIACEPKLPGFLRRDAYDRWEGGRWYDLLCAKRITMEELSPQEQGRVRRFVTSINARL